MNIKIDYNDKLFLDQYVIWKHIFGSEFWFFESPNDTDIIKIYDLPTYWSIFNSKVLNVNHQFQYDTKNKKQQYVYIEKSQFIRNAIYGDNIINAELILFTDVISEVYNKEIDKYKFAYSYRILKAFLGYSRRDLQSKDWKKTMFAYRQLYIVKNVLYSDRVPSKNEIIEQLNELDINDKEKIRTELKSLQSKLRKELNNRLDYGKIKFLPLDCGLFDFNDDLERKLYESLNIKEFKY